MDAWRVTTDGGAGLPFGPGGVSTAELLDDGTIVAWGTTAHELLGYTSREALGHRAGALLAAGRVPGGPISRWCRDGDTGELLLRHRDGRTVRVRARLSELRGGDGRRRWMVTALPSAAAIRRDVDRALLTGVAERTSIGLALLDTELRYVWVNPALIRIVGAPGEPRYGRRVHDLLPAGARHVLEAAEEVLRTGVPVNDLEYRGPVAASPDRDVALSVSCFRIEDSTGRVAGLGYALLDVTPRFRARERLKLLDEAGARLGNTLDPVAVAREAVDVVVPRLASWAAVDLLESVVAAEWVGRQGDRAGGAMRTVAESGRPRGGGTALLVPLRAGGQPLGVLRLRAAAEPLEPDDVTAAQELAQRLATCVDNAARFERERTAALALRRALLPREVPRTGALELAVRHVMAGHGQAGGAWYDVIPLSGARTALVAGRVAGRGLAAAAGIGRLRTAVRTLARLDMPPGEVLAHLDDIVVGLREESPTEGVDPGGSCLYAVYDPVERLLSLASAGHGAPLLAAPEGAARQAGPAVGPRLGEGAGLPFETAEVPLPEGSLLALCSAVPPGAGEAVERARDAGAPVDRLAGELASALRTVMPGQDHVVVVVRALGVGADRVAVWEVPQEASAVARVRAEAAGRLEAWGLAEQAFPTELVVSELVTNALRHGRPPVRLRLIRGEALTCEVFDGSDTTPHVRRARPDEEGGRGLFLVARLTERWGTRYTADGKTVWSEQPLPPAPGA